MIPEYVQKIKDWPVPKTGEEVTTFLGFTRYHRTFIPQYSVLTNRLNGIKKVEKFLLKKAFTEGGIQAFPDFGVGDPAVQIDHRLEQGEHHGGVISSIERIGEVPRMLGEKV